MTAFRFWKCPTAILYTSGFHSSQGWDMHAIHHTYSPLAKSFITGRRLVNVRTGIKAKGSWKKERNKTMLKRGVLCITVKKRLLYRTAIAKVETPVHRQTPLPVHTVPPRHGFSWHLIFEVQHPRKSHMPGSLGATLAGHQAKDTTF